MNEISDRNTDRRVAPGRGWLALSPVIVFLLLYVAVSVILNDFYKMPIAVALVAASVWEIGRAHV